MSKLILVIFECLFLNYFASNFRLMFYVLCRDIQPNRSPFVPFYALGDFFPSPPLNKCLLEYVEDIVQYMASLFSPKTLSEIIWPWCFKTYWLWSNKKFGVTSRLQFMLFFEFVVGVYFVLVSVFFELCLASTIVQYNYPVFCFHHPLDKQIDLM